MADMYLVCGVSGSGKTTWSKLFSHQSGIRRLGIDDFYAKINGDECRHYNTFDVWIEFFKAIHECEIKDENCIIDTNALSWHQRMQFVDWFKSFTHHIIYIDANQELRKRNNKSRRRQIPDDIMDQMAMSVEVPTPEIDKQWDTIVHVKNINNIFSAPIILKGKFQYEVSANG